MDTEHRRDLRSVDFRSVIASSVDGFTLIDASNGDILDANESYCEMVGYTRDELIKMHISDIDAIDTPMDVAERSQEIIRNGSLRFETKQLHKNGFEIDVEVTANYSSQDCGLFFSSVRDITQKNLIEKAHRLSDESYKNIVENQTEFVERFLPGGIMTYVNDSLAKFAGVPVEELLGKSFYPFIHPEDLEALIKQIESISAENPIVEIENRIFLPEGSVRWNRWTLTGFFDETGAIVEYQSVGRDITERKATTDALRASENRYRKLVETASEGIVVAQGNKLMFVNPEIPKLTGYDEEELLSMPFLEFIHPNYRELMKNNYVKRIIGEPVDQKYEIQILKKDGRFKWVEISGAKIDWEGQPATLNFVTDITDRKRSEESLRESEQRYRLLSETMLQGVVHQDANGRIISMNPAAEHILGKNHDEFLGNTSVQLEHQTIRENGERFPVLEHPAMIALRTGQPVASEIMGVFNPKRGEYRWITVGAVPVFRSDETNPSEVFAVFEDITERKAAADALLESREKYRAMIEAFDGYVYICSKDYRIEFMNDKLIHRTGRDATGEYCYKALHERDSQCEWCVNEKVFAGETVRWEVQSPKDGRWYEVVNSPIRKLDRTISKQAMITDITERKRAEVLLKNSEERFSKTFKTSPDLISITAMEDGRYIDVNDEFLDVTGFDRDKVIGHTSAELNVWIDLNERQQFLEALSKNGSIKNHEVKYRVKNNEVRDFLISCEVIEIEYKRCILSFIKDVSELKRAEMKLKDSERFLKTIIDSEPEAIKMLDINSNLLMMNRAGLEMIEADSFDQVKGKCVCPMVTDSYRDVFMALTKQVFQGISVTFEFEIIGLKGGRAWLESHSVPFRNENGEIVALLGITRNITERKRLEEERAALEQQLQQTQKLESLGVLAGGIAHDFNNILAIIVGNCFLAKMQPYDAESKITTIEKAAERAAELCRQMLAYAGKAQFVVGQVNMTTLVEEMVNLLKATISQNVVIKTSLSSDIPGINADASQLRQIIMNLIINASEAIGEAQGEILVSLATTAIKKGQKEKDYLGSVIPAGRYICLEVSDTGCGMDDETVKRIFEPFYTTKFTGRGLGMSAVLGIITAHKGALQLFSQPGEGTVIKIYLPVQIGDLAVDETVQQVELSPWYGKGTVLLVEDEELIIVLASAMLKEMGFTVIEATNGKEALEEYRKNAQDITLVLTDIGMPLMDGYTLFSELKTLNPELPIIISSGFGDTVVTSRIPVENIAGLVSKPYRYDQMQEVLKSVLEKSKPSHS